MEVFKKAVDLLNQGQFKEVIKLISEFLDENPKYKTIDYYHFANPIEEILFDIYIEKIDGVKTLELGENLEELYHVYSIAYDAIGDKESAEKYLLTAHSINPVSAPILMRLCEHYQSVNKEEMIKEYALDIMKYTYDSDLLVSSYFKLADYYYHTNQEMELYDHLLSFFMLLKSGEAMGDGSEDIKYLEEHGVQVGFNKEVVAILMYLYDTHKKQGLEGTSAYFKNILDGIFDFTGYLNGFR